MSTIDTKMTKNREIDDLKDVEVYHTMEPTESQANKSYLQRDPYSLVMPWESRWASIPKMPSYPEAMVEDARLSQNIKMNIKMMITDSKLHKMVG